MPFTIASPGVITLCNNTHGCYEPYVDSYERRDLASQIWARASGEGAEGEGAAAGEGSAGEGSAGEGASTEGAREGGPQGEGARGGSEGVPETDPNAIAPSPPSIYAGSDGSLPDRPGSDIGIDDAPDNSPENQEVLAMSDYATKGQGYYNLMMQAVNQKPKQEVVYHNFNARYRLRSETRSPLGVDPSPDAASDAELFQDSMGAVLHLEPITAPPEIGIDLEASDWTFRMLTSRGKPLPKVGKVDFETDATIVTYGSQSQKILLVTFADSVQNDIDIPGAAGEALMKVPNSDLMFQLLQQNGNTVSDTRFIIHHAINQKGTQAVLKDAHESKGLALTDMGTWTATDGDVFQRLLGTRNGRPAVYMVTDHPTAMKCKTVTKVFTWANIPGDSTGLGAMVTELGKVVSC